DDRPAPSSVGDLHVLAANAEAARAKAARRRTALFSLAAIAAVAAVAAVVIPITISGNQSTTSANSARDAAPAAAAGPAAPQSAAGGAAELPTDAAQNPAAQNPAAQSAPAAGGADGAAPGLGTGTGTQAERPPPGENAVTGLIPPDVPVGPQPTDTASDSCWPALAEPAIAALTAALPAGAFAAPAPLSAACGPDPVAGAELSGTAPGTSLEVRVSKAESGRCARGDSEAGVRCVPRGAGVYVVTDSGGSSTAYAYGNGDEVAVGPSSSGGLTPTGSGLTADQSVAAAQAVLNALG
ncbi:MAG: hypothetical protein ABJD68_20275, partial [Nakamurella sp.]